MWHHDDRRIRAVVETPGASAAIVRIDDRDVIRPWADVAGAKLGFLKGDVKTDGVEDANCSVVVRGNIKPAKLPIAFTVPTTAPQPQFAY